MTLQSHLVRFASDGGGCRLPLALAVTAYDEQDALGRFSATYAEDAELPPVAEMQVASRSRRSLLRSATPTTGSQS